jgi:hemolysin activation/secretion protein
MSFAHYIVIVFWLLLAASLGAQPLVQQQPLRERLDQAAPPTFANDEPSPGFVLPPIPEAGPGSRPIGDGELNLERVEFVGATAFSQAELAAVAEPFIGVGRTPEDLEELRYRLTRKYVDAGYINSGALLVTPQPVEGRVTYRLVEGSLSEIRVSGTGRLDPDYVRDRILLSAGPPVNTHALQERFRLLLQDPLIERLNGSLGPGLKSGEGRLDLQVERARPYALTLGLDNYKSVSSGEFQANLSGELRNLTGWGDALWLDLAMAEGYRNAGLAFELPLSASGLKLRLDASFSRSEIVETPLDELNIESDYEKYGGEISYPFIRELDRTLTIGLGLHAQESSNELLGQPFSFSAGEEEGRSRVASVSLPIDYVERGTNLAWAIRSNLIAGIEAFGATNHDNGTPDGQFLVWQGQFQYARLIPSLGGRLIYRANVQLSDDELLPISRFSVGGALSVRGYRENQQVGDYGYATSLEYRHPIQSRESDKIPGTLELSGFFDLGRTGLRDGGKGELLASVGLGVNWRPTPGLSLDLTWAHPLKREPLIDGDNWQDHGIHLRLAWSY